MTRRRAAKLFGTATALLVAAVLVVVVSRVGGMGAGYYAKLLCSGVFVSGRPAGSVVAEDLTLDNPLSIMVSARAMEAEQAAEAIFLGVVKRRAVFREGLGCTILVGASEDSLRSGWARAGGSAADATADATAAADEEPESAWPLGSGGVAFPLHVDSSALSAAVAAAFVDRDPSRPARTRAVAVVFGGRLVAEAYGEGWGPDMPLQGWSMTKSITNALIGIRVREGFLSPESPAPVAEWDSDGRSQITLNHLMWMSSGLEFAEEYFNPLADAPQTLFNRRSAAGLALKSRLSHEPGTHWAYSSGTTNILQLILRRTFPDPDSDYWLFPKRALFDPLGAGSAVIEPDASGTFVGSSFMYATARDWARLGLLYLQDGLWDGQRILPEGWVDYSTTPAPAARRGQYGAQIWLNSGERPEDRTWPEVPADAFYFSGFDDQFVVMIPSRDLVVVRLGLTQHPGAWNQGAFLKNVMDAIDVPD